MRRTNLLFKTGLIAIVIAFVSVLNIFAFKNSQLSTASAVRGVVFNDCNQDGLKGGGETGFENMTVTLTGRNSLGDTVTINTLTDAAGLYVLTGVSSGTYRVKFTFPVTSNGLSFSPQNQGADDGVDSDPNSLGYTDSLVVDGITDITAIDAGVVDTLLPNIVFTNPMIAALSDGDTVTVSCDNLPGMDATWVRAINNSGGADLAVDFADILIDNGNCREDGYVQFLVCTWTTQSVCGLQNQKRLYVKTIDNTAPVLSLPPDITVNLLGGDVVPAIPTSVPYTDNCTTVTLAYSEAVDTNVCGKIIHRIWTATDACGNVSRDTQNIDVILNPFCDGLPATDTVVLGPFSMTGLTKDTCLATYLGNGRVLKDMWNMGTANGVSATITSDSCITLTRTSGYSGTDTIGGWHCDGANTNCRYILLIVKIAPENPSCNIIPFDTTRLVTVVCGVNSATHCITGLNDTTSFKNTYTITDNGSAYTGGFSNCSAESSYVYEYHTLPFLGKSGPYRLDYWKLNGIDRTIASFDSMAQLVDSMNVLDPIGNWVLDTTSFSIVGGHTSNTYGEIKVTKLSNNLVGTTNVRTVSVGSGIRMNFTSGAHSVIFTKAETGCHDTLRINVVCDTLYPAYAFDDAVSILKDSSITIDALANDNTHGALVGPLTVINTPQGNAIVNGSNQIQYTPQSGFCGGTDTIQYSICNVNGCDTAIVVVTINCPIPPVALNDSVSTLKDNNITINALANDTTKGALVGALTIINTPQGGATVNGTNQIEYVPQAGFCGGTDTIQYSICNVDGCDTAMVVVSINCPVFPVALDDTISTLKDNAITIDALANDTIKGALINPLIIINAPKGGTMVNGTNQIIYTPQSGFCGGTDTIQYSICNSDGCDTAIAVVTINCPPLVFPEAIDDAVSTLKDNVIGIDVLANDTLNGTIVGSVTVVNTPKGGTTIDGSNNIVYTPQAGFCEGTDTILYRICNADGCDTAMVVVTINCPPVPPVALDDVANTSTNSGITISPLNNDTTNGSLVGALRVIGTARGSSTVNASNQIVFTPELDFCGGIDTIQYEICNVNGCDTGIVQVTVRCLVPPVANNDSSSTTENTLVVVDVLPNDVTNGALTVTPNIVKTPTNGIASINVSNRLIYTPNTGFCDGTDTIQYQICNADGCDTATVLIRVYCPIRPTAVNDVATTTKNNGVTITALANDTSNSPYVGALRVITTAKGSSVVNGSNQIVFTPQLDFCGGTDTIEYEICNAYGCDTAIVVVTVDCPPLIFPVAVNDAVSIFKDNGITISVLTNDTTNGALVGSVTVINTPKGATSVNGSNEIVYTPQSGFCGGTDTIQYSICNADGCDTAMVVVTIICPIPEAIDDAVSTLRDNVIGIDVLANDTLNGPSAGSITVINTPKGGTTVDGSNNIIYTPQAGFCGGTDTILYRICNVSSCDTGMVVVTVNCPPIPPVAVDDAVSTKKDIGITISTLANDTTNGALVGALTIINTPKGSTSVNGSNQIIYTPQSGFCGGTDTIRYAICNVYGCDTAMAVVTVNCPTPPIVLDDTVTILRDNSITISVLANDTLNGTLTGALNIINTPKGGATVNGSNQIVYIPKSGFCGGTDTIQYSICNVDGCDTGKVIITINCPPIPPDAVNDSVTTLKNNAITFSALANDTLNGTLVGVLNIINTKIGNSAVNGSNQIIYTPQTGYCGGVDTITYSICNIHGCDTAIATVTVNCPPSVPPVANNDNANTSINTAVTISVLGNDTQNGTLTKVPTIVKTPTHGGASVNGSNQIIYTPQSGYCGGTDTLTYEICNADGCDTAQVVVTVYCAPIAVDDAILTVKNTGIAFRPTVNDTINGTLSGLTIVDLPTNGGVAFAGTDSLVYIPINGFCGKDTISYRICNQYSLCDTASVIVTVDCQGDTTGNLKPAIALNDNVSTKKNTALDISVLANDTISGGLVGSIIIVNNPTRGTSLVNGNLVTYTPQSGYCGGVDSLSYQVCNANGCDTAWAFVTVTCDSSSNNANQPIAIDDAVTTARNTQVVIAPIVNDTLKGTLLSVSLVNTAKNGSVAFTNTDTLVYTPQAGYCGTDTITYSVCNTLLLCDTAIIAINVTCDTVPNTSLSPVAVNDSATTKTNQAVTIAVLINDTLNGGLNKPLSIIGNPTKGTASVSVNSIIYTPQTGFCGGKDTLRYEICNATGCDTAIVEITVNCDTVVNNKLPVAVDDNIVTRTNVPIRFKPVSNDTLNGTFGSISVVTAPKYGFASVVMPDTILYTPNTNYCGNDTMSYSVCRNDGKCDTAVVYISVSCSTGLKPDAINDNVNVNKNVTTPINVLSNDVINGLLTGKVSITLFPKNGTASVDASNNIVYVPTTDYCGVDSIKYGICNVDGCDVATVYINVSCTPVNQPDAVDDYASTYKNKAVNIDPITNDVLNGVLDSIVIITNPKNGIAVVNGNTIDYTPDNDFCADNDTIRYAICTINGCDTARIIVNIQCDSLTSQPPVAVNDSQTTTQARPITIVVLLNDSLFGANLDTAYIVESPRHGTARFDSFSNIYYAPNLNFCGGNDTLKYGICTAYGCDTAEVIINVTCDSIATLLPVAINDTATTLKGKSIIYDILANDTLNGADTVRVVSFTKHGSAVLNISYKIVYQPDTTFCNGNDTLVYEICNAAGCDTAMLVINVLCDSTSKILPIAINDTATTKLNEQIDILITQNDTLNGATKAEIVKEATHGLAVIDNNNKATYIPSDNFWGVDTFTYHICNSNGCDTAMVIIKVIATDSIVIYGGFSPNFDGKNDKYLIKGIENYPDNELIIYNRWGVKIYEKEKYTNDDAWDGTWNGKYVPDGTYFFVLFLDKGKQNRKTGYIQIHR